MEARVRTRFDARGLVVARAASACRFTPARCTTGGSRRSRGPRASSRCLARAHAGRDLRAVGRARGATGPLRLARAERLARFLDEARAPGRRRAAPRAACQRGADVLRLPRAHRPGSGQSRRAPRTAGPRGCPRRRARSRCRRTRARSCTRRSRVGTSAVARGDRRRSSLPTDRWSRSASTTRRRCSSGSAPRSRLSPRCDRVVARDTPRWAIHRARGIRARRSCVAGGFKQRYLAPRARPVRDALEVAGLGGVARFHNLPPASRGSRICRGRGRDPRAGRYRRVLAAPRSREGAPPRPAPRGQRAAGAARARGRCRLRAVASAAPSTDDDDARRDAADRCSRLARAASICSWPWIATLLRRADRRGRPVAPRRVDRRAGRALAAIDWPSLRRPEGRAGPVARRLPLRQASGLGSDDAGRSPRRSGSGRAGRRARPRRRRRAPWRLRAHALELAHVPYAIIDEARPKTAARLRAVIAPTQDRIDRALWRGCARSPSTTRDRRDRSDAPTRDELDHPLDEPAPAPRRQAQRRSLDDLSRASPTISSRSRASCPTIWHVERPDDVRTMAYAGCRRKDARRVRRQ